MILKQYFSDEEIKTLTNCEDLVKKARMLVERLFEGRVDKAGYPYIGHLYRVSNRLESVEEKCAGLLHDTLEDIDGMTPEILLDLGIPQRVIDTVLLVTKTEGVPYDVEIDNIISSGNLSAIRLKHADMSDNTDPERLKQVSEEFRQHAIKKYTRQLVKLNNALDK